MHIQRPQFDLQFSAGQTGEIEKIVDQSRLHAGIPLDQSEVLTHFERSRRVLQAIGHAIADRAQWSAQLVAEHGQEIILGPVQLIRGFVGPAFRFVKIARLLLRLGTQTERAVQIPGAEADENALNGSRDQRD